MPRGKKPINPNSKLLMTTDAAEYLGVTAQTLCKWAKENKIKRHSYGWFARDELNRFVNQGAQKT